MVNLCPTYYLICYVFSEATTTVLENFHNSTGKHLFWSLFFLKMMKLCKGICSEWISCTSTYIFFLIDWRHILLKGTIDLLLFFKEHFYGSYCSPALWRSSWKIINLRKNGGLALFKFLEKNKLKWKSGFCQRGPEGFIKNKIKKCKL